MLPTYIADNSGMCMVEVGSKNEVLKVSIKRLYDMLVQSEILEKDV